MADFLTAVSTKKTKEPENLAQKIQALNFHEEVTIDSPKAALEVLKSQPSHEALKRVLSYLTKPGCSILVPSPLSASVAHQLVNDTIPSYWKTLSGSKDAKLLAQILRNPTGLGHVFTRLRTLIADSQQSKARDESRNTPEHISDLVEVVQEILSPDGTSCQVLSCIAVDCRNESQKKLCWKEWVTQIASGRALALIAEAEDVLKKDELQREPSWIADGSQYAAWLGRNSVAIMKSSKTQLGSDSSTAIVELFAKMKSLGYLDKIVAAILSELVKDDSVRPFSKILSDLKSFEQRKYFDATIGFLVKTYFSTETSTKSGAPIATPSTVSGSACLISYLIKENDLLKDYAVTCLTRSTIPLLDDSLAARRSLVAVIAQDEDKLHNLLENCIKLFGESVYVKHTPVLQQEALAQTLALCAGYVKRTQPMFLTMMAKSSYHVNSMSNRIGAPSAKARFLGMAIGTAISQIVDKPELQLKFDLEGSEAEEAKWYQRLTEVNDKMGTIADLATLVKSQLVPVKQPNKPKTAQKAAVKPSVTEVQGPRIMEVISDSDDEDADLITYEKPDSDPEDDTDDPTAINRNKPTAPVYIRDLLAGLRDQENYDRHELALATAASLIKRKANFGTEVTDHLEDLATILTGLHNNSELEDFASQRQQALIAVLLAKPAPMAQWLVRSFFSGDYSLDQRTAMLTTLGLGARELAGLKDSSTSDAVEPAQPSFPSKQLPPHLHKLYASDPGNNTPSVAKLSSTMARAMLSPLAAEATSSLSGPTILQVRHFSSRMAVQSMRSKPTPNALAQIVADNFFFPLTARWALHARSTPDSIYTSTHLLPAFLQTLSIILHASGPNALALPQMTAEFWSLLFSVRGLALSDKNILSGLLFSFMMLLETNENKERVATECGKEVLETQAWGKMVFDGLSGGSEEDEKVRMLAAGVVVRCQEVVEKYQRRMAGDLMDY